MAVWDLDRVLAMAPDPGSVAAARHLDQSRWSDLGHSDRAVWGRCQGSGSGPYQTIVDTRAEPAYACSCPSRKQPCKHVVGLLLLWAAGRVAYSDVEAAYVRSWVESRAARGRPVEPRVTHTGDPEASAQRAAARADRVASGLDELERWLADQVRNGLAGLARAGYGHFDAIAARMVDAQAPGVASTLRGIPSQLVGEGWPERVLAQLAGLHLLVQAHRRLASLPPELAATVRSRVGYVVSKDAVLASPAVRDRWLALGAVDTVEYQLETRRVWLLGLATGRWGLWLTFAPPGQPLDTSVLPGQVLQGDLHFYPGSGQFRVLLGERTRVEDARIPEGEDVEVVHARFATLLAEDPWATRMPALIRATALPPEGAGRHQVGNPWRLRDPYGAVVELDPLPGEPWPLLAHSTVTPARVFGEWNGHRFRALSVLTGRGLHTQVWV